MRAELENKLLKKHPKIFRQSNLPMTQTAMCWGIDCGDGWYPILDILCANIQHHLDWHNAEGGFEYKRKLNEKDENHIPVRQVEATQIKEKFGGLRFYYNGGDVHIEGMVCMAEALSDRTCESCGNAGEGRNMAWIKTLCEMCYEQDVP